MINPKEPQISIGLPVFNGAKFLKDSIQSILDQSFNDFELIISDNGSIDETQMICESFQKKDSRIRYFRQKNNYGPTKNFEFVLGKARGKYFMWFAADDLAKKNFLESLYTTIVSNPSFVLVMSDVENISDENNYLYTTELASIRMEEVEKKWPTSRKLFFEVPTSNIFFCIYGLYVTDIIKKVQLNYNGKVKYATASEIPILAQVSSYGMIGSIQGALKIYRRHSQSVYNNEQSGVKSSLFKYSNQRNLLDILMHIVIASKSFTVSEKIVLSILIFRNFIFLTIDFLKNRLSIAIR